MLTKIFQENLFKESFYVWNADVLLKRVNGNIILLVQFSLREVHRIHMCVDLEFQILAA